MSMWAVTKIEHPPLRDVRPTCDDCIALTGAAIAHARVTGSVGCTYSDDRRHLPGGEIHSVTVARALAVIDEDTVT